MYRAANPAERFSAKILAGGDPNRERQYKAVYDMGSWMASGVSTLWVRYQFGLVAGTVFSGWRLWMFLDLTPKVTWTYQKVRTAIDTVETWNEMYEELKVEHQAGRLDWVYYIIYFWLGVYCFYHFVLPWGKYFRLQLVYMFSPAPTPQLGRTSSPSMR